MAQSSTKNTWYIGVDVGGTKIQTSLVHESGLITARHRQPTPRKNGPDSILHAIHETIAEFILQEQIPTQDIAAVAMGIPGVVDRDHGGITFAPNLDGFRNVNVRDFLEPKLHLPVILGNDTNVATLGENWLGAARDAESVVGLFPGTGIGGGFVWNRQLLRGAYESAAEIGHMIMEIGGPKCGCGNKGCLEALASRTAIENQIRKAIEKGADSIVPKLLDGDLSVIRSSILRQALQVDDPVVTEVMTRAAHVLGEACISIRHLFDPEMIVLGGGVVEACGDFMLNIIQKAVDEDKMTEARLGHTVHVSPLGDDAGVLGAVAMARQHIGHSPFDDKHKAEPPYPKIIRTGDKLCCYGEKYFAQDFYIRVNGVAKRCKKPLLDPEASWPRLVRKQFERACEGGPEIVFVGVPTPSDDVLPNDVQTYLQHRNIEHCILSGADVVSEYNNCSRRKAAIIAIP